ncbi:MAG: hypothetical protein AB7J28_08495 [Hyphomonadaceae bacterium]
MSSFDARAFAESMLEPGETLVWFEAAPVAPAIWGALVLAGVTTLITAGMGWLALRQARKTLETFREAQFAAAFFGAVTTLFILIFPLAFGSVAIMGWNRAFSAGSSVYAATEQRLFVAGRGVTAWIQNTDLAGLSLSVEGRDLIGSSREGDADTTYLHPREVVRFSDVEDPEAVAALLRVRAIAPAQAAAPPAPPAPQPARSIDPIAAAALAPSLHEGERLLWAQRAPEFTWSRINPGTLLFLVFWTGIWGFLLFFLYGGAISAIFFGGRGDAAHARLGGWPVLFLVSACAIFTLAAAAPTLSTLRRHSITAYGVTGERALILSTLPWREVRTFGPASFEEIQRGETWLAFDYHSGKAGGYRGRFEDVPDPAAVEALIRQEIAPFSD